MKHMKIFSLMAAAFMGGCAGSAECPDVAVVSPREFAAALAEDSTAYLLDVRRPDEYAAGHLRGAHLLNWLDTAEFEQDSRMLDKSATIYIYCRSGRRSNDAARFLSRQGYRVVDMAGGIIAWENDGLPIAEEHED
ncbi:MAG: rhodanese-like domain-containing protein [Muribaculaceae bacterium]|nr:rhodanese-like domain-containing protein [Muribaculaceae bacterium]